MVAGTATHDPHAAASGQQPPVTPVLCDWIERLDVVDIPPQVVSRAKHLILDGIACGLVGARVPWSEKCAEAVFDFEPPGYCSVIGHTESLGPLAAAILNGAFIQATELDDYHAGAPLHSASVVLPALFSAAQVLDRRSKKGPCASNADNISQPGTSGLAFLVAAIAGFETGPRAGKAMYGAQLLSRGWHSGPVFGSPAAAAASSKLLGLSATDTESAIGIACTQAGGLMAAQYEGMIKRVQHAFAARNGLFGSLLARNGYVGIKKVFDRSYGGFLAMFSQGNGHEPPYVVEKVVEGLGTHWETMDIRIKLHACVGGCHGQIEALAAMQRKYPDRFARDRLQNIKSIRVGLSAAIYAHDGWAPEERPMTTTGAQMNAAYIGAVQLVDGQVLLAQFAESSLDRDEVWDLVHKTTCVHDVEFDKPNQICGAKVTVEFDDKFIAEETILMPKGYEPPITDEDIRDKYRKVAGSVVSQQRVESIEKMVLGLEQVENITELLVLLAEPTLRPLD